MLADSLDTELMEEGGRDERPVKRSRVGREPFSASKRSRSGVKASMLKNMCMKPTCSRGKVFNRYTTEAVRRRATRHGKTVDTGSQIHLIGDQSSPLLEPRQSKAGDPKSDYNNEKRTRAQGQAEEI
jgi:hypothetical protein